MSFLSRIKIAYRSFMGNSFYEKRADMIKNRTLAAVEYFEKVHVEEVHKILEGDLEVCVEPAYDGFAGCMVGFESTGDLLRHLGCIPGAIVDGFPDIVEQMRDSVRNGYYTDAYDTLENWIENLGDHFDSLSSNGRDLLLGLRRAKREIRNLNRTLY